MTEIAKNIVCFDKDYNIVEAMKKSEDEEIMRMVEEFGDYPGRRYYTSTGTQTEDSHRKDVEHAEDM